MIEPKAAPDAVASAPLRSFTHAQLHKSALNVRRNKEDSEATSALEASIARVGLLVPLIVHPVADGDPTEWGVLAGGRRWRAIGQLIAAGKLPADWPIAAKVVSMDDAKVIEASLSENLIRRDLRPYEVHAAVAEAHDRGDSVEEIAEQLGQTPAWVRRQLRLGKLARPIFTAYAEGELSFEQASAYAATEDAELQLMAFEALNDKPSWDHSASRIRALLKVGDREAARLLLFVGEAVYVGAGGMIEPDLFADGRDVRVRITDEDLLRKLAEERFAALRERIRADMGRPDLRFAAQPPMFSGRIDDALEIPGAGELMSTKRYPTDSIVATIDVDDHGEPLTRLWWASRAAKGAAEKGQDTRAAEPIGIVAKAGEALAMPDSAYAQTGRAIAKDEYGLTADGLQLMRSLRRILLRCLMIDDAKRKGAIARDYLVWAQARRMIGGELPTMTGCRGIVDEWHDRDTPPIGLFDGYAADVPGVNEWNAHREALRGQPFMAEKDPGASLRLFLDLDDDTKNMTAAIVAGEALLRSADTPGWRIAAHDVVAAACGADALQLRKWWRPTARWLGLFGKLFRLEVGQGLVDKDTHLGFIKLKDTALSDAIATTLDPANHKSLDTSGRAGRWLPQLLAFGPDKVLARTATDPVKEQSEKAKKQLRGRANAARVREAVQ